MILVDRGLTPNVDVVLPGAKASLAGSARHAYFSMCYDATKGDVKVSGLMNYTKKGTDQWRCGHTLVVVLFHHPDSLSLSLSLRRYCSVTCYDFQSLPMAGYFDDESMNEKESGKEAGKRKFEVILTTKPTRKLGLNEIDVSKQRA